MNYIQWSNYKETQYVVCTNSFLFYAIPQLLILDQYYNEGHYEKQCQINCDLTSKLLIIRLFL